MALLSLGCASSPGGEERFLSDTLSHFGTLSDEGPGVAQAMAGASNLDSVRGALLTAKSVEGAGYESYIRGRAEAGSSGARDIAESADSAHRLFQEAMGEFLAYWADGDATHVPAGSSTLNRCIALATATVQKINARR